MKLIASTLIAALLLTGTAAAVSVSPGQGMQLQRQNIAAESTILTEAQAVAIAIEHAGLSEGEITDLRVLLDRDDRIAHWDIRFRSGDWEYDYEIHSETGLILEWDKELEPVRKTQDPPASEAPQSGSAYLTGDEALDIALNHAGLTKAQISRLEREFDRDDGRPEWDIEFVRDGWEYSYEIHAETGAILEWDRERAD